MGKVYDTFNDSLKDFIRRQQMFGREQDDPNLKDGIDLPPSVVNLLGATQ